MHQAVARLTTDRPEVLDRARRKVDEWLRTGSVHAEYARAWAEILALPSPEIGDVLTRDDERMRALRQASPFAGSLDARTRWAIWRRGREPS
jgi:hypothetical protein